jgi:hypothetical protein
MSPVQDALVRAIDDLRRIGADFALVGGLAVSIRVEPRFTRDVDCAVAVQDDRQAERFVAALLGLGYRAEAQVEQQAAGRLATMRLFGPADRTAVVDLLFASSGIEVEVVREAEMLEVLAGRRCKIARVGHLIAMKLLSRDDDQRPIDRADLMALVKAAPREEIDRARSAVAMIAARGFARGRKNLAEELEAAIGKWWKP